MYASHFICVVFNPHSIYHKVLSPFYKWESSDSEHVKVTCLDCTSLVFNCSRVIRGIFQVQFSSVAQSCLTLCEPMNYSTPGFPVHHQLLELTQTHVLRVSDAIQPYHPLSSPSPPAFNLSQHQGLFQWVSALHQVAEVLELQLQHQSFQWMLRTDFL